MLSTLLCILAIILLFALTILVHEGGHFLAARLLGLVADTFSIGMGPALWRRKIGATTYKIGLLPIGGYVAPGTPAWEAGLREGDTILAANSRPVSTWTDLTEAVALSATDTITPAWDDEDSRPLLGVV